MTQPEAYRAFIATDVTWSAELRKHFGKNAGDVRYTSKGEGEPGTPLNDAYLAFKSAGEAWRRGL